MTKHAIIYLIAAALIVVGMAGGNLHDGYLYISGWNANMVKLGSVIGIVGWFVELVYAIKQ